MVLAQDLAGKSFIVTGASSGIGATCAQMLSAAGARVTLGARRADRLEQLVATLPGEAAWREADVASLDDMTALAALAEQRFGRIDGIICNAGTMPSSPFGAGRVEDWNSIIDVNLRGVLNSVHAALPALLRQRFGHVVIVSSMAALLPPRAGSVYAASKAAVKTLGDGLRAEFTGRLGVTVVYPGAVATELAGAIPDEAARAAMDAVLQKDGLRAEDVADAILYVVSRGSRVNISEIVVRPTAIR